MDAIIFTDLNNRGFARYAGPYRVATELRDQGYNVQVIEFFTKWNYHQIQYFIDKFVTKDTAFVGFAATFLFGYWNLKKVERNKLMRRDTVNMNTKLLGDNKAGQELGTHGLTNIRSSPKALFGREDIFDVWSYIKKKNPNTQIVVGGARAAESNIPLYYNYIDYIVTYEADNSINELMKYLKNKKSITLHDTEGKAKILNGRDYPVEDFPNKNIKWEVNDFVFDNEDLPIEIARGCAFKCAYCNYPLLGKKWYEFNRTPEGIAQEMKYNYDNFGTQGYLIADETLNDHHKKISALHKEITKLPFKLTNSCYIRADILVSQLWTAELLAEMGVKSIFVGIETFHAEAGKVVGKGMHPDKMKEGLYKLKEQPGWKDIMISMGVIVGLPYESEESIWNTYEWLKQPDCPVEAFACNQLMINAGTPIGLNPGKYGFEWDEDGKWKSPWMTEDRAIEIADEMMMGPGIDHKRGKQVVQAFNYNRFRNLGMDVDDLRYNNNYHNWAPRAADKYNELMDIYLKKVENYEHKY